jgi:hypothetical protein
MSRAKAVHWEFTRRFRRGAFGWKSQPAIERVRQAASEIKTVARRDPSLGAEGAVLFLERVSPALEHVDSSSGAIGTAVNHAIEELVAVIAGAPADAKTREGWLERLWDAHANDAIPYIERLGDFWGELCVSPEIASAWADRLAPIVEMALSPDPQRHGFFHGTTACLSALFRAGRHAGILALLEKDRVPFWPYREWGVRAMAALGRPDEAIAYAEASRGINTSPIAIAAACEEVLLASGRVEEAYRRYALKAARGTSYLATYRTLAPKYPHKGSEELLGDLVATTPGDEGKWLWRALRHPDPGAGAGSLTSSHRSPKTLRKHPSKGPKTSFGGRWPDFPHNPKVAGSNPAPATNKVPVSRRAPSPVRSRNAPSYSTVGTVIRTSPHMNCPDQSRRCPPAGVLKA